MAICATTMPVRRRAACRPPLVPRPPPLSTGMRSARRIPARGASPQKSVATVAAASVISIARPSTAISSMRGMSPGEAAMKARTPTVASTMPSRPPATANTALSVSRYLTIRPWAAPRAERTPSSRARAVARTRARLATSAHARRKTSTTAPTSTASAGRTFPTSCSWRGVRFAPKPESVAGYAAARRCAMIVKRLRAWSRETPGLSRAIVRESAWLPRWFKPARLYTTAVNGR